VRRPRPVLGHNTTEERVESFFSYRRLLNTGLCENVNVLYFAYNVGNFLFISFGEASSVTRLWLLLVCDKKLVNTSLSLF
jgi:hypothetical protein